MENQGEINELDDESLQELYTWIDEIPLSRPKRNIARDFSDGGKVLGRLEYKVADDLVDGICKCRTGSIETFLISLRNKIDKYLAKKRAAALRKQHQVYDEFSPGTVSDNVSLGHEGYANGAGGNYSLPYNTVPQQEIFSHAYGMPSHHEYNVGSPYDQSSTNTALTQPNAPKGNQNINNKRESASDVKHLTGNKPPQHAAKQQRNSLQQDIPHNIRLLLEEKEQSLLASQETIQILQVKVRRLEHLLQLKDIRIDDLTRRLQQATQPPPRHLPPQHNPPVPPISGAAGQPLPRMHSTPPLPPVRSPPKYNT